MSDLSPFPLDFDGECFRPPSPFFAKRIRDRFAKGRHLLNEHHERALNSHQHFFASVTEVWKNLPDELALQFPTPDILRAHALIMTGFRRERRLIASSAQEARKIAAFLRPQAASDDYAIISVAGNAVVEWKAKSQSYRSMGKKEFMDSKWKVLEFVAALIGIEPETLKKEAGQAA